MECLSWYFADDMRKRLVLGAKAFLPDPFTGDIAYESGYDGYGHIGGKDVYEEVADWNREFLSKNPDFVLPHYGKKISDFIWYPLYRDLSLSPNDIVDEIYAVSGADRKKVCIFEYRYIGIAIACYDEDNKALPYPIKICSKPMSYQNVKGYSKSDPNQGL